MKNDLKRALPMRIAIWSVLACLVIGERPCRAAIVLGDWQPIYCGVAYATGSDGTKAVKAMRIDLQAPGIEFYATPSNGASAKDTTTAKTSTFLKDKALQVAINAGFFDFTVNAAVGADISGLHVSRGTVVSEPTNGFGSCILRITAGNVAAFDTVSALPYDTAGIFTAVPGSHFILVNGVASAETTPTANRSLAGLSADGRFLVLAALTGAHYKDCGEWLIRFGCYDGLNLDGGGSTSLVRSDGAGGATILVPSGGERYVGSHLGVFAQNQPGPLTVSFDAQGGAVSPASATVTNGLPYGALPTPTRPAYAFTGWWTGSGMAVTAATVVAASSNHTLIATWLGSPYTVTFDAQGGTVSPANATVTNGMAYGALPAPTRADYTFGGWWTGPDGSGTQVTASTSVTATESHALFAKWVAIPVVPAFEASASTGRAPFAVTFDDLSTGTITNRHWDFGDGTWTNTVSTHLVHLYTNAGVFTVTLTVSGPLGASAKTWDNPVVVYGDYKNTIPYQEAFELPGWKAGDSLIVPWNTNGWYGDPGAAVTNLSYAWPGSDYPLTTATHSSVLVYADASLTNLFVQAAGQSHVVVDFLNQLGGIVANQPDTNTLADAKTALFADAEGHLKAWCSGDQDHTNRTWVTYTNAPIGTSDWSRVTVAFDYTSDKFNGLTYFSIALNGVALAVPGGAGFAYANGRFAHSPGGIWLVSANPTVKQVNSVTFDGSGRLDDFVLTTKGLAFISFPESGKKATERALIFIR